MDKQELIELIKELYGIPECSTMILQQIYKFVTERRYSYKDIARALVFYVEVQGNTPVLKYGIAIVPYVMQEARAYFEKLKKEQERQLKDAQIAKTKNDTLNIPCRIEIDRKPGRKRHKINIEDIT